MPKTATLPEAMSVLTMWPLEGITLTFTRVLPIHAPSQRTFTIRRHQVDPPIPFLLDWLIELLRAAGNLDDNLRQVVQALLTRRLHRQNDPLRRQHPLLEILHRFIDVFVLGVGFHLLDGLHPVGLLTLHVGFDVFDAADREGSGAVADRWDVGGKGGGDAGVVFNAGEEERGYG